LAQQGGRIWVLHQELTGSTSNIYVRTFWPCFRNTQASSGVSFAAGDFAPLQIVLKDHISGSASLAVDPPSGPPSPLDITIGTGDFTLDSNFLVPQPEAYLTSLTPVSQPLPTNPSFQPSPPTTFTPGGVGIQTIQAWYKNTVNVHINNGVDPIVRNDQVESVTFIDNLANIIYEGVLPSLTLEDPVTNSMTMLTSGSTVNVYFTPAAPVDLLIFLTETLQDEISIGDLDLIEVPTGTLNGTPFTFSNDSPGTHTVYLYFIDGCRPDISDPAIGYGYVSGSITVPNGGGGGAPSVPTGLSALECNQRVTLSWTASTNTTSYNILRSTTSGGEQVIQSGITSTTYSDTTVTNGTTYYYEVQAVNGSQTSNPSTEISITPQSAPIGPTNVVATAGNNNVVLTWTASTNATSYNIYRSQSPGQGPFLASSSTTSYTDTTAQDGQTYYYVITALDSCNDESVVPPIPPIVTGSPPGNQTTFSFTNLLLPNIQSPLNYITAALQQNSVPLMASDFLFLSSDVLFYLDSNGNIQFLRKDILDSVAAAGLPSIDFPLQGGIGYLVNTSGVEVQTVTYTGIGWQNS
jgi:hypothetical protein